MMLDDFIKEFSKDKEKKKKVSDLGNIPHGSEAIIISKISEYIKKDILFICENKKKYNELKMAHAVSPLENPISIKSVRRTIARILTEISKRDNK